MPPETLGYEWDSDVDNGFRPAGEIDMSQTCQKVLEKLYTVTEELVSDNACNSLTLYRAASGALVFDSGTIQWAWGLESDHDGDTQNPPDPVMQQATVNLLADMGVQPATLESDLTAATQSTDHTPPDLDDHLAVGRCHVDERQHRHGHWHGDGFRRWRRGGCGDLYRRRLDLASRYHHVARRHQRELELHVVGGRLRPGDDQVARRR